MLNGPRASWDEHGRIKFAGQRPQQSHNSQQWEQAVAGTRSQARARFGRTDELVVDGDYKFYVESDRNMALCKVVPSDTGMRDGQPFIPYTTGRHRDVVTEQAIDIVALNKRAKARNMTLVEYLRRIGAVA